MDKKDIRWKQRYQNFEKAINNLKEAVQIDNPSEVERAGVIQFYEIAFELAWKTIKDYLNESGYDVKTPRDSIKQAFQIDIIENGHAWIDMLEKRNELTHTYDEEMAELALTKISNEYMPHLLQVFEVLKNKLSS
jgi:nucleotidyltransferase substrate binding protein (TIGR01987 family)